MSNGRFLQQQTCFMLHHLLASSRKISMALLPDWDTYPELDMSPDRATFLNFSFVEFCAHAAKFVKVVSCCQVIYIKFAVDSPFKLKFLLFGFLVNLLYVFVANLSQANFISRYLAQIQCVVCTLSRSSDVLRIPIR